MFLHVSASKVGLQLGVRSCIHGWSAYEGVCLQGSLHREGMGRPPWNQKSGRYTSYWLFSCLVIGNFVIMYRKEKYQLKESLVKIQPQPSKRRTLLTFVCGEIRITTIKLLLKTDVSAKLLTEVCHISCKRLNIKHLINSFAC